MQAIDDAVLRTMYRWGEAAPLVRTAARVLTELGGARFLFPLCIIVGIWLFVRGHRRRAILFWIVTIGGRIVVELFKFVADRERPAPSGRIVEVFSQSFPSGHAGNAMIVYLAVALIAAPTIRAGKWPLRLAVVTALGIGLTRPILGVHWPSDVLAGWCVGIVWTLTSVWMSDRWIGGDPRTAPASVIR